MGIQRLRHILFIQKLAIRFILAAIVMAIFVKLFIRDNYFFDTYKVSIEVLIFLFGVITFLGRRPDLKFTVGEILLLVVLLICLVQLLLLDGWRFFLFEGTDLLAVLLFYASLRVQFEKHGVSILGDFSICCTLILSILSIFCLYKGLKQYLQFGHLSPGNLSAFDNTGLFALFLTLLIPFCIYSIQLYITNTSWVLFSSLAVFLTVVVLVLLQARTTWVCLLMLLLSYTYYFFKRQITRVVILSVVVVITAFIVNKLQDFKKESSKGRAFIYLTSIEMAADNWPWGVGFNRYQSQYYQYQAKVLRDPQNRIHIQATDTPAYAFNEYLQIACEIGWCSLGLVMLFIIWFIACNLQSLKRRDFASFSMFLVFKVFLVASIFSYPLHYLPTVLIFFTSVAFLHYNSGHRWSIQLKAGIRPLVISFIPFLLFSLLVYKSSIRWKKVDSQLMTGIRTLSEVDEYAMLYTTLAVNPQFVYDYALRSYKREDYQRCVNLLLQLENRYCNCETLCFKGLSYEKLNVFHKAASSYLTANETVPGRLTPMYLLMMLNKSLGNESEMEKWAIRIGQLEIKVHSENAYQIKHQAALELFHLKKGLKKKVKCQ